MHKPVLLQEVIENLKIVSDGIYVDATFGRGGHSKEILKRLGPQGKLLVIDKDLAAINAAEQLKKQQSDARLVIRQGAFSRIKEFTDELNFTGKVAGILLDLGVSSPQFDESARGFSFMREGPLDMRMDQSQKITAAAWLEKASEKEIAEVLKVFGEEKFAKRIAREIVNTRKDIPISSTGQLVDIIKKAVPGYEVNKHPATRTFQALRIKINNELEELKVCLESSVKILKKGGRLLVISFHSLEDQLIKKFLRTQSEANIPKRLPIIDAKIIRQIREVGKAIAPSKEEIAKNTRARSAKLRVMEKLI